MTKLRSYGQCFDCGQAFNSKVHDLTHTTFTHIYVGVNTAATRERRAKEPRLCPSCAAGEHKGRKTEYGCIEVVAPEPRDYVCGCDTCRLMPPVGRRSRARRMESNTTLWEADHEVPLSEDGVDDVSNARTLCFADHHRVTVAGRKRLTRMLGRSKQSRTQRAKDTAKRIRRRVR